jgi:hypothetical protein
MQIVIVSSLVPSCKSSCLFRTFHVHGVYIQSCPLRTAMYKGGYSVARPQVVDGGDDLEIWRVAANILNKKFRTADNGWSSN